MGGIDAGHAVKLLSEATGEPYEMVGRLSGGETGAHAVRGPDGRRHVMKWEFDPSSQVARREAVGLTERLRTEACWPVPRQQVVESDACLFVMQDLLPGVPVTFLSQQLVDQLLELHVRRLGLARPHDDARSPARLVESLVTGGNGYCLHEPLRRYDRRTAQLVGRIEQLGRSLRPDDLSGTDLVHWDLHAGNLLVAGDDLSAVVDTDFVTIGDAAFDLVTLAVSSLAVPSEDGVRDRLFAVAFDGLTEPKRQAYLAHLFLRVIDWPIRGGRPDEVEFWLAQADHFLHV